MTDLNFPAWLRVEHWVNVLFLTLLVRSGIEILATHPKLYRRNDSRPGSEWARFTRKSMPRHKLYDTLDEEEAWSSIIALPGRKKLGMGRHWHFVSLIGWILTGLTYYVLLFATGQWHRYIPYSAQIFPEAYHDILSYLSFQLPPLLPGQPMDAIQKLTYASVIFLLAPLQILTGAAQSPSVEARFPRYVRAFGGRQCARTLHFFGLLAFLGFVAIHLIMVGWWGWPHLNALMIFGSIQHVTLAFWLSLAIIAAIVAVHIAATVWSLKSPRSVQRSFGAVVTLLVKLPLRKLPSRQHWDRYEVSPEHRVNGKPPDSLEYKIMAVHEFVDWTLRVDGLVERPITLTLADLRALRDEPKRQTTLHNCIQGWSSVGNWGGVPLSDIVDLVRPTPCARHICFWTMQETGRDEPNADGVGKFYEIIDIGMAEHSQTLLAYELNGEPLPIKHGAPLRLRVENQLGFKMTKWIERIEFVDDYEEIGEGMGGWREDHVHYDMEASV